MRGRYECSWIRKKEKRKKKKEKGKKEYLVNSSPYPNEFKF